MNEPRNGLAGGHTERARDHPGRSEMPFEIDHVGAVVHVITSRDERSAEATISAVGADGSRIAVPHASMGAGGQRRGIAAIWKRYAGPPLPEDPDADAFWTPTAFSATTWRVR